MFEQELFLYALGIILPLSIIFLIWRGLRRDAIIRRLGDQELVQSLIVQVSPMRRRIKAVFWLGAIASLILALARPVWGVDEDIVTSDGIQIIFAIDISRSMDATDVSPSRLDRARLDVLDIMTALEGNDLGIVLFAREAFTYMPLTYDLNAANVFMAGIDTGMVSLQGTNIPSAIEIALGSFENRTEAQRVIVIVTDGESHEGDAVAAAQIAAEENVLIYTIGYGTESGAQVPLYNDNGDFVGYQTTDGDDTGILVNSTLNIDLLQRIATETNGAFIPGSTDMTILIEDIGRLQSGELGERTISRPIERFPLFVGLALMLLSLEIVIPETKRGLRDEA